MPDLHANAQEQFASTHHFKPQACCPRSPGSLFSLGAVRILSSREKQRGSYPPSIPLLLHLSLSACFHEIVAFTDFVGQMLIRQSPTHLQVSWLSSGDPSGTSSRLCCKYMGSWIHSKLACMEALVWVEAYVHLFPSIAGRILLHGLRNQCDAGIGL